MIYGSEKPILEIFRFIFQLRLMYDIFISYILKVYLNKYRSRVY